MSEVFTKIGDNVGHNPAYLYIKNGWNKDINAPKLPRISVAYDLLLINRDMEDGNRFGQVFVELGYSVTNPVDNFNKKTGREIALANLKNGGMNKKNYASFFLGVGYDIEAVEFYQSLAVGIVSVPKSAIPLRLVGDDIPRPWIVQKDYDLTSKVKQFVIKHYESNSLYK